MCVRVCVCADMAAFDWQHTQDAPDERALCEGRVDLPAGQQHVLWVTFLFMTELLFSCCYPFLAFFFCEKKMGFEKQYSSNNNNNYNVSYWEKSWAVRGKYEMFITVDKYLRSLFAFLLLISVSLVLFFYFLFSLCMLLATRLARPPPPIAPVAAWTLCLWWRSLCFANQPAWLHVWLNAFVAFRRACLFVGLFTKQCEQCRDKGGRQEEGEKGGDTILQLSQTVSM